MPKQPPAPIHIRIDTQEQRSGIPALLAAMPQMQIVLSLPGIGPITARAVCARFRSLHDLLNADAAQLAMVPGVGPSRAAALEQLLHAALPTSHDALTSKRGQDVQMHATYNIIEGEAQNSSSS